jgi:hypothetical protein
MVNICQDPFKRTPSIGSQSLNDQGGGYMKDFFAREFSRSSLSRTRSRNCPRNNRGHRAGAASLAALGPGAPLRPQSAHSVAASQVQCFASSSQVSFLRFPHGEFPFSTSSQGAAQALRSLLLSPYAVCSPP